MNSDLLALLKKYIDGENGRELFVFSGPIDAEFVNAMRDDIERLSNPNRNASLFLTTYGGDAHAAYRLVQCLRSCFSETRLLLYGDCKSAGTLVAIGAHELAFGPRGELGPLDVQVQKPDEIYRRQSGLDIFQAVRVVTEQVRAAFDWYMGGLVDEGISTRTASEIASTLAAKLFEPIAAQIDPLRLGEAERAMRIAEEYGRRLGSNRLKPQALQNLTRNYPSHFVVIDEQEANQIFTNVTKMTNDELGIAEHWKSFLATPSEQPYVFTGRAICDQATEQGEINEGTINDSGGASQAMVERKQCETPAEGDSDKDPPVHAARETTSVDGQPSG